jgi:hypothetical protein
MANYLIYPTKTMKISQSYTGATSHLSHTTGSPKDYPWDEAGADNGREYFYCPCDKMKVVRIYGVGSRGTNTMWLESTSKVIFPDGTSDYVTIMITHSNDDDFKNIKKGKIFTRGQQICREGTDGYATGNHLHLSAGKGKYKNGWVQNSKGKWVLSCTNGAYKPEQLFYVDKSFTTIKNSKGLVFKEKPKAQPTKKGYTTGNYRVTADVLNVRKKATTASSKVKFENMSTNAQAKIKKLAGKPVDGYVKGLAFTALEVKGDWGKTPSGWVCLKYCEKI